MHHLAWFEGLTAEYVAIQLSPKSLCSILLMDWKAETRA